MAYKKILFILSVLASFSSFSQAKNWNEIVDLVVSTYNKDTINVYYRFDNTMIEKDLENAYSEKLDDYFKDYELNKDSLKNKNSLDDEHAHLYHDTVTVVVENIKVPYNKSIAVCQELNNRKIENYSTEKLHRKRDKPIAYISIPLIAADNKRAKVYCKYISGALSGNMGVFNLERINGKWSIINYDITFVL